MTDHNIHARTQLDQTLYEYYLNNGQIASGKTLSNLLRSHAGQEQAFFSLYSIQPEQEISEKQIFRNHADIVIQKHPQSFPEWFHANQCIDILFTLKGDCDCTISHPSKTSVRIAEHSFAIIPSHLMHSLHPSEDAMLLHLLIREDILLSHVSDLISANDEVLSYFSRILYQDQHPCILINPVYLKKDLSQILEYIYKEYMHHSKYSQNILYYCLGIMFTLMERYRCSPVQYIGLSDQKPLRFPLIYSYICDNYSHTSSKDVAEHFHISQSYLCKIFQDATSQSVTTAIQQIRMQNARSLLSKTDLPIQVIAQQVGYSDETFFIRLFKKYYQITPLQFRNTLKKER